MAERPPEALAWTWGWGEFGRLGHGDTTSMREPNGLTHEALRGVIMVACGGHHTVAALENGELLSWGWGNEGQLGSGNTFDQMFPCVVRAMGSHRVIAVACGMYHTVAVTDVGAVFCWGKGNCGQLGHGEMLGSLLPRTVSALHNEKVRQVDCGMSHTVAVTCEGVVYAWGLNSDGQLGIGKTEFEADEVDEPRRLEALEGVNVQVVACGSRHSVCVAADGEAFAWGLGDDGRLGIGDTESKTTPARIPPRERVKVCGAAGGGHHTVLLAEGGQLYSCGRGTYGQLGHGDTQGQTVLKLIEALREIKVVKVSCGDTHCLALTAQGEVYAWGAGEDGQLGKGGEEGSAVPLLVAGMEVVGDVSCGLVHSAAVPANSHAASSRVVELEEEVRALQVRLRNAEEKAQAERKQRLLLEHKLEEATHLRQKKDARHRAAPHSALDEASAGPARPPEHPSARPQVEVASVGVQTEGYLILQPSARKKTDMKPSAPVPVSLPGDGGAGAAAKKAEMRDKVLKRAAQLQAERSRGGGEGEGEGSSAAAKAVAGKGGDGGDGGRERCDRYEDFMEGVDGDVLGGGGEGEADEVDRMLQEELDGDDDLSSEASRAHSPAVPEYYLPASSAAATFGHKADGSRATGAGAAAAEDGAAKAAALQRQWAAQKSRGDEAAAALTAASKAVESKSRNGSKTAKVFSMTSKVKRGVTGFLRELKDELVSDRPGETSQRPDPGKRPDLGK